MYLKIANKDTYLVGGQQAGLVYAFRLLDFRQLCQLWCGTSSKRPWVCQQYEERLETKSKQGRVSKQKPSPMKSGATGISQL